MAYDYTFRGIGYREVYEGSPRLSYSPQGRKGFRKLACAWNDVDALAANIVGYSGVQGTRVIRQIPMEFFLGQEGELGEVNVSNLWATGVEVDRIGLDRAASGKVQGGAVDLGGGSTSIDDSAGVIRGGEAHLRVTFETLTYDVLEDDQIDTDPNTSSNYREQRRYTELGLDFGGEFLTLPGSYYKYVPSGDPVPIGLAKILPYADIVLTWKGVPRIPPCLMRGFIGGVNKYDFTIWTQNFPLEQTLTFKSEQLMLLSPVVTPYYDVGNQRTYDISYRMRLKTPGEQSGIGGTNGHNHFIRYNASGSGSQIQYLRVSADGTTDTTSYLNPVFPLVDFSYLFSLATP